MKFLPLILFICAFSNTKGQNDSLNQVLLKKRYRPVYIPLSAKGKKQKVDRPSDIAHFEVVDFRPDTSRLGFWAENRSRRELLFHTSASNTLASYLNARYTHPSGSKSFLIVLKKLRLFDTLTIHPHYGTILFRVEAFLKNNNRFVPYAYLDTVVSSFVTAKNIAAFRMPLLLSAFMNKITAIDEASVIQKNISFTYLELDSLNKRRYDYPMDTARVLRKGVYTNIEEFRNNQPTIFNYETVKDKDGHLLLYLKDEKGQLYLSRKMWGYCDGKQSYVMMDANLFPIFSVQHAFYVWGSKEYNIKLTIIPVLIPIPYFAAAAYGIEKVGEAVFRKLHVYNLDVYSGEIY